MQARVSKHIGDLHLLSGQLQEANTSYRNAIESLKSHKDWLWAGAAYEGLAATATLIKKCEAVLGKEAQGTAPNQSLFGPVGNFFKVGSGAKLTAKVYPSGGNTRSTATWSHQKVMDLFQHYKL